MEVDVMESLGIWGADVTSHALHWDGYDTSHKSAGWGKMNYPSTPDGFHTYGVYWQSGLLAFYIDGIKTAEYADARVLSVPAYFLLSLQLGGWDNNNAGAQVHNQVMEVDWLRAWSGTRAAPTTVTVDNVDTSSTEVVGTWTGSSFTPGYLGTNYAHDGNAGKGTKAFTYLPALTADYDYLVYTRWTSDANRANNVPIDIMSSNGGFSTVTADQRTNGGAWNLLGVYSLAVMNAEATIRTTSTNGYVVADAMRFKPAPTAGAITVDNADTARVTSTGAWTSTTANAGYLGSNYLHDQNTGKGTKSFSFKPVIASAGDYLVYARWPSDANRANNVPVDIVKTGGMVSTVTVNQQVNNNTWTLLGLYPLSPTNAEVKIRTNGTSGYVIADGVRVIPAGTP
ncbi:MAG: family 16 glycosylhydrolase [Gloeobacteraceae cyanobacterium ES-bin-144]|nr:family 16 glycosylhydrolase [Verrucomicrobiales bacterium]